MDTTQPTSLERLLTQLAQCLTLFAGYTSTEGTLTQLQILIDCYFEPGITIGEIATKHNLPQYTISRAVKTLALYQDGLKFSGHDLVYQSPRSSHNRTLLHLTTKGHLLLRLMNGGEPTTTS
jgi:DNA-binding MarR family transcriptional regulator